MLRKLFTLAELIGIETSTSSVRFQGLKSPLADPTDVLRKWDHRRAASSIATSLAIFWADDLGRRVASEARSNGMTPDDYSATKANAQERLQSLTATIQKLERFRRLENAAGRHQSISALP